MPAAPRCPVCDTARPRRIAYGLVLADALDDDVVLGGCLISPDAPRWRCRNPTCTCEFR